MPRQSYSCDALNRATIESAQTGGAASLFNYQYGYDPVGSVLTINRLLTEAVSGAPA